MACVRGTRFFDRAADSMKADSRAWCSLEFVGVESLAIALESTQMQCYDP
jgi:hypothetical protein